MENFTWKPSSNIEEIGRLKEAVMKRFDGYWELLSTAAGSTNSLEKTIAGLTTEAINQGTRGEAIAPSFISSRVEALAAWNPQILVDVSSKWLTPKHVDEYSWWGSAWLPTIRHLKAVNAIEREKIDVPLFSKEVSILWDSPKNSGYSWLDLIEKPRSIDFFLAVRSLAKETILESSLSADDIEKAPVEMLRLLRNKTYLLDQSARQKIYELAKSSFLYELDSSAITLEILFEFAPEFKNEFAVELINHLPQVKDPRLIIPSFYVLISNWRIP
jgi:hypothetical protein